QQFAAASTTAAKNDWFNANIPQLPTTTAAAVASQLTLTGSGSSAAARPLRAQSLPAPPRRRQGALELMPRFALQPAAFVQSPPAQLDAFGTEVRRVLTAWLAKGDVAATVSSVNWTRLSEQFRDERNLDTRAAVIEWCEKFVTMQLAGDHAAVNRLGHGDPASPGYAQLPRSTGA